MKITAKQLEPENLNGSYAEIAALLGVEAALKLHSYYRGTQVSFPVEFLSREYRLKRNMMAQISENSPLNTAIPKSG